MFIQQAFAQGAKEVCVINGNIMPCSEVVEKAAPLIGLSIVGVLAIAVLMISLFVFWVMMLVHAIKKPIENKPLWILVILLGQLIGAVVYYFAVKRVPQKKEI